MTSFSRSARPASLPDSGVQYVSRPRKGRRLSLDLLKALIALRELFREAVSARAIGKLWLQSSAIATSAFVVLFVLGTVTVISDAVTLAVIGTPLVWLMAFLMSRITEPVSEWRTRLADRASFAPSVHSAIVSKIREDRLPIPTLFARRRTDSVGTIATKSC